MIPEDPAAEFSDVLAANRAYGRSFTLGGISPQAARGLAVVLCIDSRLDPLAMLGLREGDAKILRNAGGRATSDAIRSLVLATHLLGVDRVLMVPHTRCAGGSADDEAVKRSIMEHSGLDLGDYPLYATADQVGSLRSDLELLNADPFIKKGTVFAGAIYDVDTGLLGPLIT